MNREDFKLLENNLIYFDNGATTLKPKVVRDAIDRYYNEYSANAHRGDYKISAIVDSLYEGTREKVANFINAKEPSEIVFTSGTTNGMNMIVFGFFKKYLKEGDEVLITLSEHASNIIPWFILQKEIGIKVKYIELNDKHEVDIINVRNAITNKTKVISLAYITNVIGDERPIKEISKLAHDNNILMVVDAAQGAPHKKINVQEDDIDFMAFSGHKMYGPTGIGVLYGKFDLLDKMEPMNYGGGMNAMFTKDGYVELREIPTRLEGGTPNIEGVIGLGEAVTYLENIGIDKINEYEKNLRKYLIDELSKLDFIEIYNKDNDSNIVAFNIKGVFAQDTAVYLDKYNICVRAGNHCAKMLNNVFNISNTVRISLSFYNNKEEIDLLINVLKNSANIWKEIL
ncbi:MAG: aminotransferase class V-fold PLP-dependent enzyme [Bacilli bacterium]